MKVIGLTQIVEMIDLIQEQRRVEKIWERTCYFCHKDLSKVKKLVRRKRKKRREVITWFISAIKTFRVELVSGRVNICKACIENFGEEIKEEFGGKNLKLWGRATKKLLGVTLTPRQAVKELDQYVISQDEAKKVLATAFHNHNKRRIYQNGSFKRELKREHVLRADMPEQIDLIPNHILLLGSTGIGKTLIAERLAKLFDFPISFVDATAITEHGYLGLDVESICEPLLLCRPELPFKVRLKRAENGVVFVDEIDKSAAKVGSGNGDHDVNGRQVLEDLLGLIHGRVIRLKKPGQNKVKTKKTSAEYVTLKTNGILFILSGAFPGLEKIIAKRQAGSSIGFRAEVGRNDDTNFGDVNAGDLIEYGFTPEFVGRVPIVQPLKDLSLSDIVTILSGPKNALVKQHQALLKQDSCALSFTEEALLLIAQKAIETKMGARGLPRMLEKIMTPFQYMIPHIEGRTQVRTTRSVVKFMLEDRKQCTEDQVDEFTLKHIKKVNVNKWSKVGMR